MVSKALLAFALAAQSVHAMMRFACSQLVVERFDPLVTPGVVSPHLHQIVGGNAFNVTMDPANNLHDLSSCTTCTYKEDTSNYWTAVMYFKHPNGTYKRVPQRANVGLGDANAGMTVYYILPYSGSTKVTAFQKGFRMIVGDAMLRSMNTTNIEAKAVSFRCWAKSFGDDESAPGTGKDTFNFPPAYCPGGIRTNIFFPTCWDGKNLDSPDHKSHVRYPDGTRNAVDNLSGKCPKSHPVQLPQLFLETVWDTRDFESIWPKDGSNPLVYSMGDPTGYGQHADYVFGWKDDALQKAMDANCGPGSGCKVLTAQSNADINKCQLKSRVAETIDGWLEALPGCNPIQAGPGRAEPRSGCGAPTTYV